MLVSVIRSIWPPKIYPSTSLQWISRSIFITSFSLTHSHNSSKTTFNNTLSRSLSKLPWNQVQPRRFLLQSKPRRRLTLRWNGASRRWRYRRCCRNVRQSFGDKNLLTQQMARRWSLVTYPAKVTVASIRRTLSTLTTNKLLMRGVAGTCLLAAPIRAQSSSRGAWTTSYTTEA